MTFTKDNTQKQIVNALMARQSKITVGNIEIHLKPLKRDTMLNREREATKRAASLLTIL